MKTQLTAEESAKLIELGVSPERASMCLLNLDYDSEVIPCEDVWEENGRLLANVNDEVIDVDRKIVTKDSDFDHSYANDNPIFTLSDLIGILPISIEHGGYAEAKLNIYTRPHRRECWVAKYIVSAKTILYDGAGYELIDALYEVLYKLLDSQIKLD